MSDTHPMDQTAEGDLPVESRIDAELLETLLDRVDDGVCLLDVNHKVLYWNHGAERITGYLAQQVSGRHCSEELVLCQNGEGENLCDQNCPMALIRHDAKPRESELYIRHRDGYRVPVRMRGHAILDRAGKVTAIAEIFARATAQGRTELAEAARHLGHDALTGAQNRAYGEMRLKHELEVMGCFGLATAWLRVDLDGVDGLRERYGPVMVETSLRMVAHTIDANLRSFDALVRWDEHSFRVMARHAVVSRVEELAHRLELMVENSRVPWWGEGRAVTVSAAGVMAAAGDSVEALEQRVSQALELRQGRAGDDQCGCGSHGDCPGCGKA